MAHPGLFRAQHRSAGAPWRSCHRVSERALALAAVAGCHEPMGDVATAVATLLIAAALAESASPSCGEPRPRCRRRFAFDRSTNRSTPRLQEYDVDHERSSEHADPEQGSRRPAGSHGVISRTIRALIDRALANQAALRRATTPYSQSAEHAESLVEAQSSQLAGLTRRRAFPRNRRLGKPDRPRRHARVDRAPEKPSPSFQEQQIRFLRDNKLIR